jgi:hypothetical protein
LTLRYPYSRRFDSLSRLTNSHNRLVPKFALVHWNRTLTLWDSRRVRLARALKRLVTGSTMDSETYQSRNVEATLKTLKQSARFLHASQYGIQRYPSTHAKLIGRHVPTSLASSWTVRLGFLVKDVDSLIDFMPFATTPSTKNVSPEWMISMIADGRIASKSFKNTRACPRYATFRQLSLLSQRKRTHHRDCRCTLSKSTSTS